MKMMLFVVLNKARTPVKNMKKQSSNQCYNDEDGVVVEVVVIIIMVPQRVT